MISIADIREKANKFDQIMDQINALESLKMKESTSFEDSEELQREINRLHLHLPILKKHEQSKKLDHYLDEFDLSPVEDEKSKINFILSGILVEREITMFAASPGTGKSLSAIIIANIVLENSTVSKVIYFDDDNGLSTLIDRGVPKLKSKYGSNFVYIHNSKSSKSQMWQIVKALEENDLSRYLIIFDSIKNFMHDGDRDKNKDVSKVMGRLKKLRSQKATILYLHHTNKPQRDLDPNYAGSSAFLEDCTNAFILKKNLHRNTLIFSPIKNRTGDLVEKAFLIDLNKHQLVDVDLTWAKETYVEEIIRLEIQDYLKSCDEPPIYTQIMKNIASLGYAKDAVNSVIQSGKGHYWTSTKIREQHNKDVFELIALDTASDKSDNLDNLHIELYTEHRSLSNTKDNFVGGYENDV